MRFLSKIFSPFWRWALFLVLIPILELFLLLNFTPYGLGLWVTLLSMFVGGLFGLFLARREGVRHWIELNRQLDRGEPPTQHVLHGILILHAAMLMILPGLLSGLVGLFLLFPLTRSLVVSYFMLHFEAHRLRAQRNNTSPSPEVIDV